MTPPKSHHDFCGSLCLLCLKKGPQLSTIKSGDGGRPRSHDYDSYIKNLWWSSYDSSDPNLPRMICMNCRLGLLNHSYPIENNPSPLPPRIEYEKLVLKAVTRQAVPCDCDICLKGRFTFEKVKPPPYYSFIPSPDQAIPQGRKRKSTPETRCNKCYQIIGKGIKHPCNRLNKQLALDELVKSSSETSKSKIIAGMCLVLN